MNKTKSARKRYLKEPRPTANGLVPQGATERSYLERLQEKPWL